MIITLTGENTFAIAEATRQIIDTFAAKHGAHAIEQVDAEALQPSHLPDLLQGTTLFAPARLVVIKNLSANKALHEPLINALARTNQETTVVIADSSLDKRTRLYTFLKTKTTFKNLAQLSEAQQVAWIQQYATLLGGHISKDDALYLVRRVRSNQWQLYNDLKKLIDYQPAVTRQTIQDLTEQNPEGNAFELLDAALAGHAERVTELVAALKTQEDPFKLFGLLASQVHTLAVVAYADNRGADSIAKEAAVHPFVIRKIQQNAKNITKKRVQRMADAVATCDAHLKGSGGDPWQLIQIALGKIVVQAKTISDK